MALLQNCIGGWRFKKSIKVISLGQSNRFRLNCILCLYPTIVFLQRQELCLFINSLISTTPQPFEKCSIKRDFVICLLNGVDVDNVNFRPGP